MSTTKFLKVIPEEVKTEFSVNEVFDKIINQDEAEKQEAYTLGFVGKDDFEKIKGVVRIAYSHYLRSLRHAEINQSPKKHPYFKEYFCHWLSQDVVYSRYPTALDKLRLLYPEPKKQNEQFLDGQSDWFRFE